jgi:hypothetical protein
MCRCPLHVYAALASNWFQAQVWGQACRRLTHASRSAVAAAAGSCGRVCIVLWADIAKGAHSCGDRETVSGAVSPDRAHPDRAPVGRARFTRQVRAEFCTLLVSSRCSPGRLQIWSLPKPCHTVRCEFMMSDTASAGRYQTGVPGDAWSLLCRPRQGAAPTASATSSWPPRAPSAAPSAPCRRCCSSIAALLLKIWSLVCWMK